MTPSKLFKTFLSCFRPPFHGLPLVVWAYFAASFFLHLESNILQGKLIDSDDYTLLSHTIDWLKGQGWFDIIQYRMNPPEGVPLHFSRLNEIPLAGLISLFRLFGLDWTSSALVAAAVWPLILFAGLLGGLVMLSRSFLPRDWARLVVFVALFALPVTLQFMPGRVDHHGVSLLLTLFSMICILRMIERPQEIRWGFGAGLLLALGQAIALETLPFLLVCSIFVGLWMMVTGRSASSSGVIFGITLYFASALFLMATKPVAAWLEPDQLAYSVVYVLLANSIALCFAAVALAAQTRMIKLRYAAGVVSAFITAFFFFMLFPEMLTGPYGAMDSAISDYLFNGVAEMQPGVASGSLVITLLVLSGFFTAVGLYPETTNKKLWPKWTFNFMLLITAFLLTSYYQVRYSSFAVLFGLIPLTLFLQRSLVWAGKHWRGRKLVALEAGLILLVGPLPSVFLPALFDGRAFNTGVLLFSVQQSEHVCDNVKLAKALNDPALTDGKSLVLMNSVNEGSSLLFRTPHKILGAPYHTNVRGNLDTKAFFSSRDPEQARKIARKRGIDLVVMCRDLPIAYYDDDTKNKLASSPAEDDEDIVELPPEATFAQQLMAGKIPDWLKAVKIPRAAQVLVFKATP